MLLLNQAYFWDGEDEDLIFEWLKNISFNFKPIDD